MAVIEQDVKPVVIGVALDIAAKILLVGCRFPGKWDTTAKLYRHYSYHVYLWTQLGNLPSLEATFKILPQRRHILKFASFKSTK